ncbi:MAG: hypothetical protein WAQ52_05200 [Terriglobales bacterium]
MSKAPESAPIFVRVHTRVVNEKPRSKRERDHRDKWSNFALVFDCETTTDLRQDLTFLWWRFCELKYGVYVCQQEGVVHRDDLEKESIALIRNFVRNKRAEVEEGCPTNILVQSRTQFVDSRFWLALQAGAVVVCFNAPFDLSRLAVEYREAQRKTTGWSMVLWQYRGQPDKMKGRLRIKPKDSRAAFISLAGGDPNNRVEYRGRFLDLSVLGWALRSRHMSLEGFLKSFGLEGKLRHEPTGRVTRKELAYGRRDVERTVALLNAMKREYDGFPIDLPPERAMSAASITKAFLDRMQIKQPAEKFDVPDHILGKCMQAYYGGRSEIRIRHQEVPVVVCDTTSEYPTVAVLFQLWRLLIAKSVEIEECATEARGLLRRISVERLLDPSTWKYLAFFAAVKPDAHILPVRSIYRETGNTNIGVNPLTSNQPIWYSGPDLAAATLLTGRPPKILEAFRLVPNGVQPSIAGTTIGKRRIDPTKDDFFRAVIEERKTLPKSHPHYLLLKIIANSLYGIFAELNKDEYGKNNLKQVKVYSGDFETQEIRDKVERPGRWQFAPAAALITAGGRLMLAILEKMAEQYQGTYLLTDTDSMLFVASKTGGLVPCPGGSNRTEDATPAVKAMTWDQVSVICQRLNTLNPYDQTVVGQILKIEDCNRNGSGAQHQLYGLAISAKRYAVYKRHKSTIEIIKPSEHGLGMVYVPDKRPRYKPSDCLDQDNEYPRWIVEAWERLLDDHFRNIRNPEDNLVGRELWFGNLPAIMRIRVTTPNVMQALRRRDPGSAKPYNFALSPILAQAPPQCTLIAPFSKNSWDWLRQEYTEIHTGESVTLGSEYRGTKLQPQTLTSILWRHYLHGEDKSLAPDGSASDAWTRGLLSRRPVIAEPKFQYIGKEVERRAQEGEDPSLLENAGPMLYGRRPARRTRPADRSMIERAKVFGLRQLMRASGKSQHSVEGFLAGENVHPGTRRALEQAIQNLEASFERKN